MPIAALEHLDWSWNSFGEWVGRLDGVGGRERRVPGRPLGGTAGGDGRGRRGRGRHRGPGTGDGVGPGPLARRGCPGVLHLAGADPQRRRRHARAVARRVALGARGTVPGPVGRTPARHSSSSCRGVSTGSARTRSTSWRRCRCWPTAPPTGTCSGSRRSTPMASSTSSRRRRARPRRGATVVALTLPHTMKIRLSFEPGAILDSLPGWREMFALARDRAHGGPVRPGRAGPSRRGGQVQRGRHHRRLGALGEPRHRRDLRARQRRLRRAFGG